MWGEGGVAGCDIIMLNVTVCDREGEGSKLTKNSVT